MDSLWRCSFERFCYMNMMGGSVKSDGNILNLFFCTMVALCHSRRGRCFDKLTWPTPTSAKLFHTTLSVISGDDHILIMESWLAYTPPGYPLPVKEWNQINHGTFVYPLHELLDLFQ